MLDPVALARALDVTRAKPSGARGVTRWAAPPLPSPARVALLPELREFPLDVFAVVGQVLLGGVQPCLKHHARGLRLGLHRLALLLPRRRLLFEPSRGVFFVLSKPNLEMLGRLAPFLLPNWSQQTEQEYIADLPKSLRGDAKSMGIEAFR